MSSNQLFLKRFSSLAVCCLLFILCFFILSCERLSNFINSEERYVWRGARPEVILQTGEHPIWFQLTEDGPVHIESIEDAVLSSAFVPWPYALHIRFLHQREDELVMVVNRGGFLKVTPNEKPVPGIALYSFVNDLMKQYSTGGFVFYEDEPAALLYLDDRFMDSDLPPPETVTWSFNMESNTPFPIEIPALQLLEEDGWVADTLRTGSDGLTYYRVRSGSSVRMFRTNDLTQVGNEISVDVFFDLTQRQTNFPYSSLPDLPTGFFYTGIGFAGDSLFASWEEQQDYSIGAAGFMIIKY